MQSAEDFFDSHLFAERAQWVDDFRARDREIEANIFKRCKIAICKAMNPGDHKPEYYEGMQVALKSLDSVLRDLG